MNWQRLTIAAVLGYVAAFGVPSVPRAVPGFSVDAPSEQMKTKVVDVAAALRPASEVDRAVWAAVWERAAIVVAAPEGTEVVFTDTRSLRGFTVLSLDIAWRRLAGNQPAKYAGLREAVEKAMAGVVGIEVVPVTTDLRKQYADACRAIAWAGIGNGG